MNHYQKDLVHLLLETGALSFGEFTLKSGRKSPYFINTGKFSNGRTMTRLGEIYAKHIHDIGLDDVDHIFGPAYKGVPLAVTTAMGIAREYGKEPSILFNRKEAKDHGEKGAFVGDPILDGQRMIVVDDVVTAGTTMNEILPLLRSQAEIVIAAVVILVDRCEKGQGDKTAIQEVQETHSVKIAPVMTIHQIIEYLSSDEAEQKGIALTAEQQASAQAYLTQYAI